MSLPPRYNKLGATGLRHRLTLILSSCTITLVVLIFASTYEPINAEICEDNLVQCSTFTEHCNNEVIRQHCPKSCKLCRQGSCDVENGGCSQICSSGNNLAVCSCYTGFKLDSDRKTCIDINECVETPTPCPLDKPECVNNVGSFSCQTNSCKKGGTTNYYRSNSCCIAKNDSCGITASIRANFKKIDDSRRVFGGFNSVLTAWPWMVQFVYRGSALCGGTLISDRWVVTAAHCLAIDTNLIELVAYLGQTRSGHLPIVDKSRRIRRGIRQFIIHPDAAPFINDIALIELEESVPFSSIISPVCLPCGESPKVGQKCWVTGFGVTEYTAGYTSDVLKEVDVPIASSTDCRLAYDQLIEINPKQMICAGYPEGGKDACNGDSGGPMVCQREDSCSWYLTGVTSFGSGCGEAGFYGVYANVLTYEPWIRETIGTELNMCSKIYNPCRGKSNLASKCYIKLDLCTIFDDYMGTNCDLACCQFEYKEIENCHDKQELKQVCSDYKHLCNNPAFSEFMRTNCKKTCLNC